MSIIDMKTESVQDNDLSTLMRLTGRHTVDMDFENLTYSVSDRKQGLKESQEVIQYIMQDDQLNPLFTVNEIMMMAAQLKLGAGLSTKTKQMLIHGVLETIGLSATTNTRCGRLSGGQKKRLSIALELIDNPPVLFLDEPTSGLDSSSSAQCLSMLKDLARGGRTVVCTIHQPSAALFLEMDHVYVLAAGTCVYKGDSANVVPFLGSLGLHCPQYHNPADYLLEVANKEYGDFTEQMNFAAQDNSWRSDDDPEKLQMISIERENHHNNNTLKPSDSEEFAKTMVLVGPASEFCKFWILLQRCFVQLYRDWTVTHLKAIIHVLVAVILGLLYGDSGSNGLKTISNVSLYLVSLVYLCYTTMMPAILKLPSELPVLRKESFNNWYKLRTYYTAFLVANIPVQIMFSVLFCSVSYVMTYQPLEMYRFLMYVAICVLVTLASDGIGIFLGSVTDPVNGTFFGAIFTCTMLVFAGFLVQFTHMPIVWSYISNISYLKFGLEGLFIAGYGYGRANLPCPEDIYCHFRSPKTITKELDMNLDNYWVDVGVLAAFFVAVRIAGYCTLKRTLRNG
ncbi:ATP-binding cassette sub-family G member 4-like [Ctenocephalides felis]|uniref:ATP-binding cassette sub-family G member 4-like n=1 Tax=Ctenocephalides felis TaxID=7515 RepID=UPI000E6E5039|nr:ATP-binding cassette sub-family G member 4-like [Ctenocephalides felis]